MNQFSQNPPGVVSGDCHSDMLSKDELRQRSASRDLPKSILRAQNLSAIPTPWTTPYTHTFTRISMDDTSRELEKIFNSDRDIQHP